MTHALDALAGSSCVERALPTAFDDPSLHNGARLIHSDPLTIAGAAPQWGYLAVFARIERPPTQSLEAIQVRLRVLEGTVSVGLVDSAGTAFLDSEDSIAAGSTAAVTFIVNDMQHVGQLVVRNAADAPVAFEWLGAESFQLKSESALLREQRLWPDRMAPLPEWSRYYGRFAATTDEAVRQVLFEELREPLVMPWRQDLRVLITPGEETSRALFVSGAYEPTSMIVLQRLLSPGAVLIDVGANVGLYTLVGSRLVGTTGRVYSFEPSSRERDVLERNLALSACDNVTVIPAAASEKSGTGRLNVAGGQHRGQNTLALSFAYPGVEAERVETVALAALDDLWREGTIRRPDVLKIDAEGSELHVLRGAESLLRQTMPVIFFEINDTLLQASGSSRSEVERFLMGLGYVLHGLDQRTAEPMRVATLMGEDSENFLALPS